MTGFLSGRVIQDDSLDGGKLTEGSVGLDRLSQEVIDELGGNGGNEGKYVVNGEEQEEIEISSATHLVLSGSPVVVRAGSGGFDVEASDPVRIYSKSETSIGHREYDLYLSGSRVDLRGEVLCNGKAVTTVEDVTNRLEGYVVNSAEGAGNTVDVRVLCGNDLVLRSDEGGVRIDGMYGSFHSRTSIDITTNEELLYNNKEVATVETITNQKVKSVNIEATDGWINLYSKSGVGLNTPMDVNLDGENVNVYTNATRGRFLYNGKEVATTNQLNALVDTMAKNMSALYVELGAYTKQDYSGKINQLKKWLVMLPKVVSSLLLSYLLAF